MLDDGDSNSSRSEVAGEAPAATGDPWHAFSGAGDRRAVDHSAVLLMMFAEMSEVIADERHDLRQSLAAIGLAAHNGRLMIDRGMADGAATKFDTVIAQVERCQTQMSANAVASIPEDTAQPIAFVQGVLEAIDPMRRRIAEAGTLLSVVARDSRSSVMLRPEALACLTSLALSRVTNVVRDPRQPHVIELALSEEGEALIIAVHHRGLLRDDAVLSARVMDKIVTRAGGHMICRSAGDWSSTILSLPRFRTEQTAAGA